jgi:hypothetical protein
MAISSRRGYNENGGGQNVKRNNFLSMINGNNDDQQ